MSVALVCIITLLKTRRYCWLAICVLLLLSGCAQHAPAPVFDLNQPEKYSSHDKIVEKNTQKKKTVTRSRTYQGERQTVSNDVLSYVVKPGDTLFSIAWYHALDHKALAKLNHLKGNIIYPGQTLKLRRQKTEAVFDSESLLMALNQEILKYPVEIAGVDKGRHKSSKKSPVKTTSTKKSKKEIKTRPVKVKSSNKQKAQPKAVVKTKKRSNSRNRKNIHWIWPSDGAVIQLFSSKTNANRGLDIAGKKGQPVRASASGRVVYKGSGLRGYGNLLIIKHNDDYLSAYAHNNKIHVTENEYVKAGQRIADIGSSGTRKDKLHFEIRYKGKPVDPLNYLPQK